MDLLSLLNENARLTNAQLAVMLGKTEEEVEKEIADYQQKGIIKGYKALINWEKVDHHKTTALIELKVQPKKESGFDEIAKKIMQFSKVESVYLMSGGFDLAVMVHGDSIQDIAMFVAHRLSPIDSVNSTATHFILKKYKERGVVFEEEIKDERRMTLL